MIFQKFSVLIHVLIAFLTFLCTVSNCNGRLSHTVTASSSEKQLRDVADGFISTMESTGFDVREGFISYGFADECEEKLLTGGDEVICGFPNPVTPYGMYDVPQIEGEYVDDDGLMLFMNRIRGDEAIVMIDKTAPESAYYGYTHYIGSRHVNASDGGLERLVINGALSDTLNPTNIKLDRPIHGSIEDSFDKDVVLIATPHRDVYESIKEAFIQEGVSPNSINLQVIAPELFKWGLGKEADSIYLEHRVSLVQNETLGEAYFNDPPAIVLRVTPKIELAVTDPYEKPVRVEQFMDTNELYLKETLGALEASVLETYGTSITALPPGKPNPDETKDDGCILQNSNCMGLTSDGTYFGFFGPPIKDEQFYVILGVNHVKSNTGAGFVSVTAYNFDTQAPAAYFDNEHDMDGSTNLYLDESYEHRDSLYAMSMRRDCTGYEFCVELDKGIMGVPDDEMIYMMFRTYLQHNSTVGPPHNRILWDKVYFVNTTLDANATPLEEK